MNELDELMEVSLLAGKIMLMSGAETYRVEDTMRRLAQSFAAKTSHAFVTPTGIILSVGGADGTKEKTTFIRITDRSNDLHKVAMVNHVSREASAGKLSLHEALTQLKAVDKAETSFPEWVQVSAAAFVSAAFLLMFDGSWSDAAPAFITGGTGYYLFLRFQKGLHVRFFSELFAAFSIGVIARLFVYVSFGSALDLIIIGSIMPLVPGVLITNAVRDLMAGHLVSGLSRGAEAFLTATAIGAGIAIVIAWI
ncbi:MAG TPA: threonine/serine exporter family protein [Bacillales bacterium]|nr:threonine/serine exporter family protein [Bacillales bacterium]